MEKREREQPSGILALNTECPVVPVLSIWPNAWTTSFLEEIIEVLKEYHDHIHKCESEIWDRQLAVMRLVVEVSR